MTNLTQQHIDFLDKVENEPLNFGKITTKKLKDIALLLWNQDIVDDIFDPLDTCLCSGSRRQLYKQKMFIRYNEFKNQADEII